MMFVSLSDIIRCTNSESDLMRHFGSQVVVVVVSVASFFSSQQDNLIRCVCVVQEEYNELDGETR